MSPFTPPNACGASPDPSRLAQQSLRAFWSWTPLAPFLGLKSPWLEIWSPHLRAMGLLTQGAYAPGSAFSGPKAPQTAPEAEPEAEAKAKPAPKAKKAAEAKAKPEPVAEPAPEAPAAAEPAPKTAKKVEAKAAAKEAPKAAKDLFDAPLEAAAPEAPAPQAVEPERAAEAAPAPEPEKAETEPSLEATFAPAAAAEEAASAAPEAPAADSAPAALDDDLTRVDGVGPATARRLVEQGVRRYADLAGLTPEALIEIRRVGSLTITEEQAREIIASAANLARPH